MVQNREKLKIGFDPDPSGHPEAPQDAAVRLSDRFFVVLGASGDPSGIILDQFSQRFSKQNQSAFVLIFGIS